MPSLTMQVQTPHGPWAALEDEEMGLLRAEVGASMQPQAGAQRLQALQALFRQGSPAAPPPPWGLQPIGALEWPCLVRLESMDEDTRTVAAALVQRTDRPLDLVAITAENPPQFFLAGVEVERYYACVGAFGQPSPGPGAPSSRAPKHNFVFPHSLKPPR